MNAPILGTPLDRLVQRAKDEEAAKRHGPQCYADGDVTSVPQCGWPELHKPLPLDKNRRATA